MVFSPVNNNDNSLISSCHEEGSDIYFTPTSVISTPHKSLVIELLSPLFYRWKNRLRSVSKNKVFSISNLTVSPLHHSHPPVINHTNTVDTEMKIIIQREDNENLMFWKIFKTFFYGRDIQPWKQKNTPNNLPPIISTFVTKYVNYLNGSYVPVKLVGVSWLNEKWTSNTKYCPFVFLIPNLPSASRGISSYKIYTFQKFNRMYDF